MTFLRKNLDFLRSTRSIDVSEDPSLSELEELAQVLELPLENLLTFSLSTLELPWSDIRFIFLDVDGVLTEGGMFYTEDGDEFKRFDTKDGMAIKTAMGTGLEFGIISSGVNRRIIEHRAQMFGIEHVYVGTDPKLGVAERWLEKLDMNWNNCAYIGDDINDLKMFERVAISACPSDATLPIKRAASFVLQSKGGHGCVREFMRCFPQLKERL